MLALFFRTYCCLLLISLVCGCVPSATDTDSEPTKPPPATAVTAPDESEPVSVVTELVSVATEPTAARGTPATPASDLLRFTFQRAVEGYTVSVVWQPREQTYADRIIGPAILTFDNGSNSFTLTSNYFALPGALFGGAPEGQDWRSRMANFPATVPYQTPDLTAESLTIEAPFAFVDLNFDGNKELLLTKFGAGQRSVDAYEVHHLDDGDLGLAYIQITSEDPYRYLDALSRIDPANRELMIYSSGGACYSRQEIYTPDEPGKMVLTRKVVYEMEDATMDCYRYDYTVRNGVDKLVAKKKVD